MSDYTSKLNLYKVDPTIDGEEKFNIKTMMNNNWDKIDTKVSEIDQKLSGIEDNANNYKHPSTHNAEMINIQDADGKFSSGNVEGALQEVGASMADIAYKANNNTTAIASKENKLNDDQKRRITLSTSGPSGGANGDIWIKYKA
jgi:DNA repair ATPase RecN